MRFQFWSRRYDGNAGDAKPTAAPTGAYQSALVAIKERFCVRMAEDYAFLAEFQGKPLADFPDVVARIHRLAGSAGMVGFNEISAAARRLDDAFTQSNSDTTAQDFQELLRLMEDATSSSKQRTVPKIN